MKVCEKCGEEIGTKDGDNICAGCEDTENNARKRAAANKQRRERDDVMRSLGLVKVKGALGGTYWE